MPRFSRFLGWSSRCSGGTPASALPRIYGDHEVEVEIQSGACGYLPPRALNWCRNAQVHRETDGRLATSREPKRTDEDQAFE